MGIENKNMHIEIVSIEENKQLECVEKCENSNDCGKIGYLNLGTRNAAGVSLSHVYLIVQNTSDENLDIEYNKFTAIDNDGFSYKGCDFGCEYYAKSKFYNVGHYSLPPKVKVRFLVMFQSKRISRIIYEDSYPDFYFSIDVDNISNSKKVSIESLKQEIYNKNDLIKRLKSELERNREELKNSQEELKEVSEELNTFQRVLKERGGWSETIKRRREDLLIKYEIVEDDDYYRMISLEKEDTVSFHREFDKTKGNYNWINEGDALISLKADNAFGYNMDGRTIIKSPVSGIFEFNNNKMIGYKEEICRIKKYSMEMKDRIIEDLEKKEIKENVYKKEREKILERQVLDELIEEGKVFNAYTKKDGNRTTIPMDIANAVWNRDGGKCCICGSRDNLEFDHIIPISKGGATTFRNLQILCKNCNIRKSDNI